MGSGDSWYTCLYYVASHLGPGAKYLHCYWTNRTHLLHTMGYLCFIRGAFTHGGCYAAQLRNYAGLFKCATSLPASGLRVKKYCHATADRKSVSGQFVCYHLHHRTIVKLQGKETSTFLQGLITNDMGLLVEEPEQSAMYSHILSVQGRTLYDIILYRYAFV